MLNDLKKMLFLCVCANEQVVHLCILIVKTVHGLHPALLVLVRKNVAQLDWPVYIQRSNITSTG